MSKQVITRVFLRDYPKVIFFYPLFFTSLVLWIIQLFLPTPLSTLGYIWFIVFFCNLFVISYDFSSTRFFVLVLAIVVVILLVIFLVLPNIALPILPLTFELGLPSNFYLLMTIILGILLTFVILISHYDYYKVERNEIYHKAGIFTSAERFPTENLRIKKEISDVFEFFALRAGSITLIPGKGDSIQLATVPNVNKKSKQMDFLLSHIAVEPDELDNK